MINPLLKIILYIVLLVALYACIIRYFSKDSDAAFNPKVLEILKTAGEDNRTVIISKPDTVIIITKGSEFDNADYISDPKVNFVTGDKVIQKPGSSSDITKNGLVAYYPFKGNADDASGNKNHGIVHGATLTEDRFGNPKSAYYFDGKDDEIYLGESSILNIRETVTIYFDFYVSSFNNTICPIIYKGLINSSKEVFNGTERTYSVWINNNGIIHLSTADLSGSQFLNTPRSTVVLNKWYSYLAIIDRNSGIMKSYLNGSLLCSTSIRNGSSVSTGSPLLIGSSMEKTSKFSNFNGKVDEVRIYNRILSEIEIEKLFNRKAK